MRECSRLFICVKADLSDLALGDLSAGLLADVVSIEAEAAVTRFASHLADRLQKTVMHNFNPTPGMLQFYTRLDSLDDLRQHAALGCLDTALGAAYSRVEALALSGLHSWVGLDHPFYRLKIRALISA